MVNKALIKVMKDGKQRVNKSDERMVNKALIKVTKGW